MLFILRVWIHVDSTDNTDRAVSGGEGDGQAREMRQVPYGKGTSRTGERLYTVVPQVWTKSNYNMSPMVRYSPIVA